VPRRPGAANLRLLSKVAQLYYDHNLTQNQIAERLGLSRPKVSRLIRQARREGIVQIRVTSPPGSFTEMEQQLEERFGLLEAIIVEVDTSTDSAVVAQELGDAAAEYLIRSIQDGDVIGVSWGTTLKAMVNGLPPIETTDVHIVQLIGGLGPPEAEIHATELCRRIAHMLGGRLTLISAPGIVSGLDVKEALLSDSHIHHAFSLFETITTAYVGIGVPLPTSVVMRDGTIIAPEQLEELLTLNAVGDIALRFFDACGEPVNASFDEHVFGISLDTLRQIKRVVGVAGGPEKRTAVYGALLGDLVNVLITDQHLAQQLLDANLCPSPAS
jgi:DNA-binding transcriptional regulator LsrR (DeoR family)